MPLQYSVVRLQIYIKKSSKASESPKNALLVKYFTALKNRILHYAYGFLFHGRPKTVEAGHKATKKPEVRPPAFK